MSLPHLEALPSDLQRYHDAAPAASLAAVVADPARYADPLLAELDRVAADPDYASGDDPWMLHIYALFLLAGWRETRAFPALLQLARMPEDQLDALLGDHMTETLPRALAACCDDDGKLHTLALDESASFWGRSAAFDALAIRVLEGDSDRAGLVQWLGDTGRALFARLPASTTQRDEATNETAELLDTVVYTATQIGAAELAEEILGWYDKGWINPELADRTMLAEDLQQPFEACQAALRERSSGGYPRDVLEEIGTWACFSEDDLDELDEDEEDGEPQAPFRREEPKVGRNDPCPCGSGKKFKKCHGA
ncbi:DUF1186 domain-containing protein [Chitinimonas lacunae]